MSYIYRSISSFWWMDQTRPLGVDQEAMKLAVSVLVLFVVCGGCIVGLLAFGVRRAEQESAQQAAAQRVQQAQRNEVLRADIPAALERVRAGTAEMTTRFDAHEYEAAMVRLRADEAIVTEYRGLPAAPAELTAELTTWTGIATRVRRADEIIQQCNAARDAFANGKRLRRDPIGADEFFASAAAALTRAGEVPEDIQRATRCPTVAEVERTRARIAPAVIRETARRVEIRLRCGEAPSVSGWDGELSGAESFVAEGAYDPDSIDVEACTVPVLYDRTCWQSDCIVEGKNAFGMLIRNRQRFYVSSGGVYSARTVR